MLKKLSFTTSSQRYVITINKKYFRKKPLLKTEIEGLKNSSGRNNTGKITVFHKGGGHKQNYRKIDLFQRTDSVGIVTSIEYDPNRTAQIASIYNFFKKYYYYTIAPKNLLIGNIIKSGPNAEIHNGHTLPLYKIPQGSYIYNVDLTKNKQFKMSRAAGTFSQLIEKTSNFCKIKLPSGQQKKISIKCYASIGVVSNLMFSTEGRKKAGKSRWLNKRPTVRGIAMNPIDHPNGGGEGKKSGRGLTPWGYPNRKGKTRNRAFL